ncbi:MAG TPA: NAD(P)/FAD-dependent oxidoreductase [Acidimicrobiales bacterium]|nr:NAD(P)/FAD-dependent oxidoreductase [Acidimicrobiales bacterium]
MVVVGAGHNGLTAAAYLAKAGKKTLVLERRDRVGGACTLETPFDDERWVVSPCAYLVGLLDQIVIDELDLRRHGYRVHPIDPHIWCPFEDGTAFTMWHDDRRTAESIEAIAPKDVEGYFEYADLFGRIRRALRHGTRDTWVGEAPTRDEIEALLDDDPELIDVVFHASIADVVERHVTDERMRTALHGQGCIGTNAGPRDAGTAAVHLMHAMGTLEGMPGAWGYVHGGMGRVSFALREAATGAGAHVRTDTPVAGIIPGEGVVLEGGDVIHAETVVSNADPKRTLALLDGGDDVVPTAFRQRVDKWKTESPVLKINCALSRLPRFNSNTEDATPYRGTVTISTGVDATQAAYEKSKRGEPAPDWCELYFHTAYDDSIAPPGRHTMSVFAQYVPGRLADGDWDARREEVADLAMRSIARFAPDVEEVVEHRQVLAPPDVEARIGLSGGHIFQGECLPDQMWDRRFAPRTPVPGLYLCGAATHPGGSVIGLNGRNAASAVVADLER